ncbi:site-specific integrase [Iamia sp.]|uniref:site-specific integrase n=1 Tax=Iamia sp. TaxID=2722710 RepID=UPI002C6632D9|nr:site-specific integrase [Iamia sp.]HXH59117.1 site-specific integrase [Iamia sp.]
MTRQRRAGGGVDRLPSGRYRVRIVTTDGQRLSLGTHTTKRAAETAYARSLTEQADGKRIAPRTAGVTLTEYAPRWLDARLTSRGEPLRPRVRELYRGQLDRHILPALGDVALDRLSTATVRTWTAHLRGPAGPGASTAAKCYRLLRSIMATAVEDGLALTNPCTIKGAGVEPADERPIPTVEQVHALAATIHPRFRCVVLAAAFVGLRKGEILGLRRRDVDLDQATLTVAQQRQLDTTGAHLVGPPKTDAGRRAISLPGALLDDLRHHLDIYAQPSADGYVFTGHKGGPLAPHVLQHEWARFLSGGVDRVRYCGKQVENSRKKE